MKTSKINMAFCLVSSLFIAQACAMGDEGNPVDSEPPATGGASATGGSTSKDADGDTYIDVKTGGNDCDDTRATVHPGAPKDCTNGLDNDCNGKLDKDEAECRNCDEGATKACNCSTTSVDGHSTCTNNAWGACLECKSTGTGGATGAGGATSTGGSPATGGATNVPQTICREMQAEKMCTLDLKYLVGSGNSISTLSPQGMCGDTKDFSGVGSKWGKLCSTDTINCSSGTCSCTTLVPDEYWLVVNGTFDLGGVGTWFFGQAKGAEAQALCPNNYDSTRGICRGTEGFKQYGTVVLGTTTLSVWANPYTNAGDGASVIMKVDC